MLLLFLYLLLPSPLLSIRQNSSRTNMYNMLEPIRMETCQKNKWLVRHYIVFICTFSDLGDPDLAKRTIKPIACDPTNGILVRFGKKPLFPGEEHKADDGFVYECAKEPKTGALVYRAKSCFMNEERFLPGHFLQMTFNNMILCYKELDGLLRIRVRRPAHTACNPLIRDVRCNQGIVQTILSSNYGYGEEFSYNPVDGESLTVATPPPKELVEVNLQEDRPSVSAQEILQAIRGKIVPSYLRKTDEKVNVGLSEVAKKA